MFWVAGTVWSSQVDKIMNSKFEGQVKIHGKFVYGKIPISFGVEKLIGKFPFPFRVAKTCWQIPFPFWVLKLMGKSPFHSGLLVIVVQPFLQYLVATALTMWTNQRAEFKSFCNLIEWHSSHSCKQIKILENCCMHVSYNGFPSSCNIRLQERELSFNQIAGFEFCSLIGSHG